MFEVEFSISRSVYSQFLFKKHFKFKDSFSNAASNDNNKCSTTGVSFLGP